MIRKFTAPTAQVESVRKRKLTYSVTPIGGKEELLAWKKQREKFEAEWQALQEPKRQEARAKAVENVANQNANTALSALEVAELKYVTARANDFKDVSKAAPTLPPTEEPKASPRSFKAVLWGVAKTLWANAFPQDR